MKNFIVSSFIFLATLISVDACAINSQHKIKKDMRTQWLQSYSPEGGMWQSFVGDNVYVEVFDFVREELKKQAVRTRSQVLTLAKKNEDQKKSVDLLKALEAHLWENSLSEILTLFCKFRTYCHFLGLYDANGLGIALGKGRYTGIHTTNDFILNDSIWKDAHNPPYYFHMAAFQHKKLKKSCEFTRAIFDDGSVAGPLYMRRPESKKIIGFVRYVRTFEPVNIKSCKSLHESIIHLLSNLPEK